MRQNNLRQRGPRHREIPDMNAEEKEVVYSKVEKRLESFVSACDSTETVSFISCVLNHNAQCVNPFYHPAGVVTTFSEDSAVPPELLKKRPLSVCMQSDLYSNSKVPLTDEDFQFDGVKEKINEKFKEYQLIQKKNKIQKEQVKLDDHATAIKYTDVNDEDLALSARDIVGIYRNTKDFGRGNMEDRYVVMVYVSARPDIGKEYRNRLSKMMKEGGSKSLKDLTMSSLVKNHETYLKNRARALAYAFASIFQHRINIKHMYAGPPTSQYYQPLLAIEDFMQINNGLEIVGYGKDMDRHRVTNELDANYVGKNVIASFSMSTNPFSTFRKDGKVNVDVGKIMILCTPADGYVTSKVDKKNFPGYGMGMSMSKFYQCPYKVTKEEVDPNVLESHVSYVNAEGTEVVNPKWKSGMYMNTVETFFDSDKNARWRRGLMEESIKYWKPVMVKQAMMKC